MSPESSYKAARDPSADTANTPNGSSGSSSRSPGHESAFDVPVASSTRRSSASTKTSTDSPSGAIRSTSPLTTPIRSSAPSLYRHTHDSASLPRAASANKAPPSGVRVAIPPGQGSFFPEVGPTRRLALPWTRSISNRCRWVARRACSSDRQTSAAPRLPGVSPSDHGSQIVVACFVRGSKERSLVPVATSARVSSGVNTASRHASSGSASSSETWSFTRSTRKRRRDPVAPVWKSVAKTAHAPEPESAARRTTPASSGGAPSDSRRPSQ